MTQFDAKRFPPSNGEGGMQTLFHAAAIALSTGFLAFANVWTIAPLILVQGILLLALFAPNHECVHRTVFRTGWLNDWMAWIIGLILFIPSIDFRYFHFAHHRHTQDPDKDPELAEPKPEGLVGYIWVLTGIPLWIGTVKWFGNLIFGGAQSDYLPSGKRGAARLQAIQYVLIYAVLIIASVLFQTWALVIFWLAPIVLAQPFLRAYLMAEHTGCDHSRDMFANTRTILSNPLVRALMWNMPLHAEHHAQPTVPFYALPELHQASQGMHHRIEPGYRATHQQLVARIKTDSTNA